MTSAYTARKTALHDAWGISDNKQRNLAVKAAWKAFEAAQKSASQAWRTVRKDAWKAFHDARKACKGQDEITAAELKGEVSDQD